MSATEARQTGMGLDGRAVTAFRSLPRGWQSLAVGFEEAPECISVRAVFVGPTAVHHRTVEEGGRLMVADRPEAVVTHRATGRLLAEMPTFRTALGLAQALATIPEPWPTENPTTPTAWTAAAREIIQEHRNRAMDAYYARLWDEEECAQPIDWHCRPGDAG